MKYLISEAQKKGLDFDNSSIMKYIIRRVDWLDVIEAFTESLNFAEGRYWKYKDKWNDMSFDKYNNMVVSVLIDHLHLDLFDDGKIDLPYDGIFNKLSEVFHEEINLSYERVK